MSVERFRRTRMVVLNPMSTAYQAARAMADNHIGAVLVSGPGGVAGIVTDRDLALAVLGGGLDPKTTPLVESCPRRWSPVRSARISIRSWASCSNTAFGAFP
ncbi:CBS domain-containing protein [Pseudaminobacter sp. 19-2017]|uniref:CBS domain-containing protein n=1 Tax=Pseudaminobacter soli (ex Zhang et al. 2022) TaxID=2831468 RepID=A0A942ICA8_9HYPH|nr:CBS domain-containing protein [Pseudaminobacter soli]